MFYFTYFFKYFIYFLFFVFKYKKVNATNIASNKKIQNLKIFIGKPLPLPDLKSHS